MTSMWQLVRGEPHYKFQTDDKAIAEKMRRRKFHLAAWGVNCNLWIYQSAYSRPDIARKVFKTLTGKVPIYNKNKDIFSD